jgi:hypothetical protein
VIAAAGIDSWSPAWYVDRESMAARMLDELAHVPAARGTLMPEAIAGHRIGWVASSGLLYAEGHPGGEEGLLSPDVLPEALQGVVDAMLAAGVPVPNGVARVASFGDDGALPDADAEPGFAGVRRFDATVDLQCESRGRGLAILAGVAAVATSAPRAQAEVRFAKDGTGTVETVYLRGYSGVKVLGRWYDKGLESFGSGRRGLLVRAEDQRRFPKGHRRDVSELTGEYVRTKFCDRFLPLWQATKGVTVAGPLVLADKVAELVDEGELTARQAESLVGYLVLSKRGLRQGRSTVYSRRRRLRDLGLVVADGALEEVEVDLHEVLEQALDGGSWGAQG